MPLPTMQELANMSDAEVAAYTFVSEEPEAVIEEPITEVIDEPVVEEPAIVVETSEEEEQPEVPVVEEPVVNAESEEPKLDADGNPIPGSEPAVVVPASVAAELTDTDFRKAIMAPLKANKRDIEIRSVDEARTLMSKGANYGRKMQILAPHLKTIKMLEDNGIQNEQELAFLIDLRNKNPGAIQKLLKDSQFDTLAFNPEDNVDYTPQTPVVTDRAVQFNSAVEDLLDNHETGRELLSSIQGNWDAQSVEALADNTQTLYDLNQHKASGVYDVIMSEMDRQKALGTIPAHLTTMQAYTIIGDHIRDNEGFDAHLTPEQIERITKRTMQNPAPAAMVTQRQPVATRVAVPRPSVQNNDKARAAASTTKSTAKQPTLSVAAVAKLSDDEFMKQFSGRL